MATLTPTVDLDRRVLTVSAPDCRDLELNLDEDSKYDDGGSIVKVCGNRCGGILWGDFAVSEWFSEYLGVRCWLARHSDGHYHLPDDACATGPPSLRSRQIAFANEQPLLLISEHAVDALNDVLTSQNERSVSSRHFRPNLVVRLVGQARKTKAHEEDGWSRLRVEEKGVQFDVVGECARCSMVDVDPSTGMKGKTLRALADYRRRNGQITFGIFLRGQSNELSLLQKKDVLVEEGDIVFCE
jgi:molybdenum cofactor sulfurtransferase